MKLLRTIRLDPSDTFVFEQCGGARRMGSDRRLHIHRRRSLEARRQGARGVPLGFLGVASLGWSTLVQIVEASDDDRLAAIDTLAKQFVAHFGAPSIEDAVAAAEEEFEFAASLCNHPLDTLIAMHRSHDGGEIRETFRTLRPKDGPKPLRAFAFLEVEGEDEPADEVDLAAMAKKRQERQVTAAVMLRRRAMRRATGRSLHLDAGFLDDLAPFGEIGAACARRTSPASLRSRRSPPAPDICRGMPDRRKFFASRR